MKISPKRAFFVSALMIALREEKEADEMELFEIARQVHELTAREVGQMLEKSIEEIAESLERRRGFVLTKDVQVIAYAAIYEWQHYYEIGSVVTHPGYRRQGYAEQVTALTIKRARCLGNKPIIALTNSHSTPLFLKLGFKEAPKSSGHHELWESCEPGGCPEFCHWPECHCRLMILSD